MPIRSHRRACFKCLALSRSGRDPFFSHSSIGANAWMLVRDFKGRDFSTSCKEAQHLKVELFHTFA
eukprot:759333-Hanusia_phi.AAC.4